MRHPPIDRRLVARLAGPVAAAVLAALPPSAAGQDQIPSRVEIAWNRLYDHEGITELVRNLVAAYPELLTLQSIGESEQGRGMWLVTLNNPATGPAHEKPAMWIDGNVHGNEVQAAETVVYSIWYLTKSYGAVEPLTELCDRAAFYFVPMVNPDGRAFWFDEPNTPSSSRSGQRPTDNDFDGLLDEDGPEDLDGDGHIGRMWRLDPNGTHRRNRIDPRIIERVTDPRDTGELSWGGSEGIDNDGDGRINEDGPGGYDMNRNWPSDWQPGYIQFGAGDHPFSYPETKAIGDFIFAHPNIAAGQSYHNAGGMILRGPGADYLEDRYAADRGVYDRLGKAGEEMLPFYRYMIIHADLYTVHGGFVTWLSEGLGITSFTNELWSNARILQDRGKRLDAEGRMRWQDRVLFGQTFTDWTEHDHPTLGRVLIGGDTKFASRNTPPFMLEEGCHRNFAFTMFHAAQMPLLSFDWTEVKRLGGNLWQITVEIENEKIIPTRLAIAARQKLGSPDRLELAGPGVTVVASGPLRDRFDLTIDPVEHRPQVILENRGIPGEGRRTYRFIVEGPAAAEVTLRYTAEKARDIETTVTLE